MTTTVTSALPTSCWYSQASCTVPVCDCDISVFRCLSDLPLAQWNGILTDQQYFLHTNYLRILESTCPQIEPRYVLFKQNNEVIAVAVFQLIQLRGSDNFRFKKTISTHKACLNPSTYFKNLATDWVNNLSVRLLVCGNSLMTGEHGFFYHGLKIDAKTAFAGLQKAINILVTTEKQSSHPIQMVLVKDFEEQHLPAARQLCEFGLHEVAGQPNMVLPLRPEWQTMDDYMSAMTAKYRTRTKSILKKGVSLERKRLDSTEIQAVLPQLYSYYIDVCHHADFNLAVCTPDYFAQGLQQLPHQFELLAYYLDQKLVGFISYFITPMGLESHFIGYDYDLNHDHAIYNNILLDLVKTGIEHRLPMVHLGRTATEIKSTVGAIPTQQNAFVQHLNPIINRAVARLVNTLRNDNWVQRHPFK